MKQRQTQFFNLTNNHKDKKYFILPEFSATKIVTWGFHVDDSAKSRYNIILGRAILTALVLYLKIPITSSKEVMDRLRGAHQPLLIWVYMNSFFFKYS